MCNNAGITRERRGKERKRMKERSKNEHQKTASSPLSESCLRNRTGAIFASADFSRTPWELDRARNDRTKIGPRSCCCCYYFSFFFLRPKQVASKHRRDSRRTSEIARAAEVVEAGGGEIGCGGRRQRFLVQPDRVPGAAIPVSLHS